jgi:hypothetical protein
MNKKVRKSLKVIKFKLSVSKMVQISSEFSKIVIAEIEKQFSE